MPVAADIGARSVAVEADVVARLGALEAAMGMLMFGWATALLVQVIQAAREPTSEAADRDQIR